MVAMRSATQRTARTSRTRWDIMRLQTSFCGVENGCARPLPPGSQKFECGALHSASGECN